MYAGLVSHCVQEYAGEFELLFGVSSLEDAAVREVARLRVEYPGVSIRLVECKAEAWARVGRCRTWCRCCRRLGLSM